MDKKATAIELRIDGMTCDNCEKRIAKKLRQTAGITRADVSYDTGRAQVSYDENTITASAIVAAIESLDYKVLPEGKTDFSRLCGLLLVIVSLYILVGQFALTGGDFPLAEAGMDYGLLFVIGLVTSLHCVAMCGGINLSQCIPAAQKHSALRPSFFYNLGRVLSYTAIGAIVGAVGAILTPSGSFKGVVQILAGIFMVVMGINMLSLLPGLRRLRLHLPPRLAEFVQSAKNGGKSPLYVGLLNGLMPCGPLQAMQLYALSTASPLRGALAMMCFSLGTVPLMFGLGALSSLLTRRWRRHITTAGAVLIVVLGLSMLTSGLSLSGFSVGGSNASTAAVVSGGVQVVTTTLAPGSYPSINVSAGMPVEWQIDAPPGSINGCNNRLFIPEYNIEHQFTTGENTISFTPVAKGTYTFSCWMGMIRGTIEVR
jgi:sulfite exporter TauE/SafE/copper chaperone CopZ